MHSCEELPLCQIFQAIPVEQTISSDLMKAAIRSDFEKVGALLSDAMSQQPVKIVVESDQPLLPGIEV